ncbi:MAG: hypothetical protein HC900_09605 [Methylacidiphilales bacterium]|nr:hypothetical protein [Candidatus Methylacidiphilales bacterium]
MTLVDPAFRSDLRVLLHRCTRDRLPIRGQYRESHPPGRLVRLAMHPVDNSEADDPLFMLSFEEADPARPRGKKAAGLVNEVDVQQVATLEQELKATKENLQSVVEELETSNEELQATNEELHASNEELQASNEELETTNEELQATNEELSTVNDELSAKTNALAEINGELEGILANSVEAIVLIDPKLQVLRYNSKAARILRLSPMPDKQNLLKSGIVADMPQILTWIETVLTTGRNHVGEIRIDQGTFLMQISANKVRKRLRGAIITVSDMTELRRAQQAAAEHGRRAEHLIETFERGHHHHRPHPAAWWCAILPPAPSWMSWPTRSSASRRTACSSTATARTRCWSTCCRPQAPTPSAGWRSQSRATTSSAISTCCSANSRSRAAATAPSRCATIPVSAR